MPDMTGIDVLKQIRADSIPSIFRPVVEQHFLHAIGVVII